MPVKKVFRRYVSNIISFANSHIRNTHRDRSEEFFAGEVTTELEESMRKVWQPLIGNDYEILVLHIRKPKNASNLGISLQGVSEVREPVLNPAAEPTGVHEGMPNGAATAEQWKPVESRHFVHSVIPDGPIGRLNIVRPGDELLQVNGRRLRGTSHSSTVRCLRNLPNHIELILARAKPNSQATETPLEPPASLDTQVPVMEVLASEVGSVDTALSTEQYDMRPLRDPIRVQRAASLSPNTAQKRVSDWVRHSLVNTELDYTLPLDPNALPQPTAPTAPTIPQPPYPNASSTMRTDRSGLGDTLDHSSTLPPRRAASFQHNRSISTRPGIGSDAASRFSTVARPGPPLDPRYKSKRPVWSKVPLLFQLTKTTHGFGFSLSEYEELTVSDSEATKTRHSLTLGLVGSTMQKSSRVRRSSTMPSGSRLPRRRGKKRPGILLVDSVVPGGAAYEDGRISVGDRLLFVNDRNLTRATLREAAAALRAAPKGPCLLGIAKMHLEPNVMEPTWDAPTGYTPPALYGSVNPISRTLDRPLHVNIGMDTMDGAQGSYTMGDWQHPVLNFHTLPFTDAQLHLHDPKLVCLPVDRLEEKSVEIKLDLAPLGIKLDALAAGGQDGCRVIEVLQGGAIFKNNALGVNDYVTEINGRDMCGLTNLEAFQILRDISSTCDTVSIRYIPSSAVAMHRQIELECRSQLERPPLIPPVNPADDPESGNHLDAPIKSWMRVGRVILRREPYENAWGLELTDQVPEQFSQITPFPTLEHPTWIAQIAPNSPADRCGSLRPGDLILQVQNRDVSNVGPDETSTLLRRLLDDQSLEVWLGVSYCALVDAAPPTENPVSEVNQTLVVADVEQGRTSLSAVPQRPTGTLASETQVNGPLRERSPESSQMETPEPLTELESRDELNVLTRSIPSPVQQNGVQTDSGEEGGRPSQDREVPVVSIACPVIRDEAPAPLSLVNGHLVNGGPASPTPPPLPPRRFSREAKPMPVEVEQQLPIATGDPVALYTRTFPPGDEIITVNLKLNDGPESVGDGTMPPAELVTTPCKVEHLGIRLVGSRMPEKVATYIGGFCPGSIVANQGVLNVGDEIVQVGQFSVSGFSRLTVRRSLARTIAEAIAQWQSSGCDPNQPPELTMIVRRNPVHSEMMASNHSSPERDQSNASRELLSPPVVPSRAGFSEAAFAEVTKSQTTEQTGIQRDSTPVSRHPVAPEIVKQIAARLKESLLGLNIFDVELKRDEDGYGIYIVNLGPNDEPGVFVSELMKSGAAAKAFHQGELQAGDRILAVNGTVPEDYDSTLRLLKQSDSKVRLTVGRTVAPYPVQVNAPVATSSPAPELTNKAVLPKLPLPQPIIPGVKTLVELRREPSSTFGFSVVGGKDTVLEDILIHEVHANGVAARDGRLCTGDRLLEVNGVSLQGADHTKALEAIRSAGDCLQLLVYRDLTPRFVLESDVQLITALITREPGQNLGLSLISRSPYSTGTAIGEVLKGTVAEKGGLLQPGDVLVEINGRDVRLAQTTEVASLLKESQGQILIKVERSPASRRPPYPPVLPYYQLHVYTVVLQRSPPIAPDGSNELSQLGFALPALDLTKADASFGLILREATLEEVEATGGRLIVESIQPDSPAALSAMILPTDRLLSVDREPVDWLRPDEVSELLSKLQSCSLELGHFTPGPPYPVEVDSGDISEPPYPPPSQELPQMFGGVMPVIEPPCGLHEIGTVEEEEDHEDVTTDKLPVESQSTAAEPDKKGLVDSEMHQSVALSDTCSSVSLAPETRSAGGFQFRQIVLPLAPAPPSREDGVACWSDVDSTIIRPVLGIRLVKGPGISGPVVVSVKPGSPAEQAGIRLGDRILGMDDSLLLAVAANRSTKEIVAMIEEQWLAHCSSSADNPKPVCLTVINVPQADDAEPPDDVPVETEPVQNGYAENQSQCDPPNRNGHSAADVTSEKHPIPGSDEEDQDDQLHSTEADQSQKPTTDAADQSRKPTADAADQSQKPIADAADQSESAVPPEE